MSQNFRFDTVLTHSGSILRIIKEIPKRYKKERMIEMKKTMMAAATPDRAADCRDNVPCVEAAYTCCGGGYGEHRGRGGRGGYGCGGGYCYGYDNNEG